MHRHDDGARLLSYETAISVKSRIPALPVASPPGKFCETPGGGGRPVGEDGAAPLPPHPQPGPPQPPAPGSVPGRGEGCSTHQRMMEGCRREVGLLSAIPGGAVPCRWVPVGEAAGDRALPPLPQPVLGRGAAAHPARPPPAAQPCPGPRNPRPYRHGLTASLCNPAGRTAGLGGVGPAPTRAWVQT